MRVDLRSDTVTRPTSGMKQAMMDAALGDDVFGDDPTVNHLEQKAAALFGKQAALFCASGTMSNQIAIKTHTRPGDEVICHKLSHIYYYEGGGIAFNSGASVCLLEGDRGLITAQDVELHINPAADPHRPLTRLVSVENTMNKGGGAIYSLGPLKEIGSICQKHGLKYHLDGARLFNALAETGEPPADYGPVFDSISICLSKGLGAPVGSLLLGDSDFINYARRMRKVFGGGMRQAGILAAAGIYALDHHVGRLKEDHRRARLVAGVLEKLPWVQSVGKVETNMIFFELTPALPVEKFIALLRSHDIHALALAPQQVRFVFHLDINDQQLEYLIESLNGIKL